jgi:tetratricopeptide (TPR) repeat protein
MIIMLCCPRYSSGTSMRSFFKSRLDSRKPKGVSVFHLQTVFRDEVGSYKRNLDEATEKKQKCVYDIEDISGSTHGLIRQKGAHVTCPRDRRPGAAYVDCLGEDGDDHVGPANVMLSYSWANSVEDIVNVLESFCSKNNLDPKRTYVWICCLCVNQHRVAETKKSGKGSEPFDELKKIFESQVRNIPDTVALLSPWDEPIYLKRVWCIFELFTASRYKCSLHIEMPKREKEELKKKILCGGGKGCGDEGALHRIFKALSNTNIKEAEATEEDDKRNILKLVDSSCGHEKLDVEINILLRKWIHETIDEHINELEVLLESSSLKDKNEIIIKLEDAYNSAVHIFVRYGIYDKAMDYSKKELHLCESNFHKGNRRTARSYYNLGIVLCKININENRALMLSAKKRVTYAFYNIEKATHKALRKALRKAYPKYEQALTFFDKSMTMYDNLGRDKHQLEIANVYYGIGMACDGKEEFDEAIEYYNKCVQPFIDKYGPKHKKTAEIYNAMGVTFYHKGQNEKALKYYNMSLSIYEDMYGTNHPGINEVYHNIARIYEKQGDNEEARRLNELAASSLEKIFGKDHPTTLNTRKYISCTKARSWRGRR